MFGVYHLLPSCSQKPCLRRCCLQGCHHDVFSLNLKMASYLLGICFSFFQDKVSNIIAKDDLELLILGIPLCSTRISVHRYAWFYSVLGIRVCWASTLPTLRWLCLPFAWSPTHLFCPTSLALGAHWTLDAISQVTASAQGTLPLSPAQLPLFQKPL